MLFYTCKSLWNEAALNTIEFIPPSSLEYMFSSNSMQVVIYSKAFEEKKKQQITICHENNFEKKNCLSLAFLFHKPLNGLWKRKAKDKQFFFSKLFS